MTNEDELGDMDVKGLLEDLSTIPQDSIKIRVLRAAFKSVYWKGYKNGEGAYHDILTDQVEMLFLNHQMISKLISASIVQTDDLTPEN